MFSMQRKYDIGSNYTHNAQSAEQTMEDQLLEIDLQIKLDVSHDLLITKIDRERATSRCYLRKRGARHVIESWIEPKSVNRNTGPPRNGPGFLNCVGSFELTLAAFQT